MLATTIELKVSRMQWNIPSDDSLELSDRLACWTSNVVIDCERIPIQAMKLCIFFFTVVLQFLLALRMSEPFRCGEPCNCTFSNSRGLSNHCNSCQIYFHRKTALAIGAQTQQLKWAHSVAHDRQCHLLRPLLLVLQCTSSRLLQLQMIPPQADARWHTKWAYSTCIVSVHLSSSTPYCSWHATPSQTPCLPTPDDPTTQLTPDGTPNEPTQPISSLSIGSLPLPTIVDTPCPSQTHCLSTPEDPTTQLMPDGTPNEPTQPTSSPPICPLPLPTIVDIPCPSQTCCLPCHYQDELPEPMVPAVPIHPVIESPPSLTRWVILHVFDSFQTLFNKFWITHDYHHCLSYDPDAFLSVLDLSDLPHHHEVDLNGAHESCDDCYGPSGEREPPWPWENMSIWRLMTWKLTGSSQKSNGEVTHLVRDVIQAMDFNVDDFTNFNASTQLKRLEDKIAPDTTMAFDCDDWREEAPEIIIPICKKQ